MTHGQDPAVQKTQTALRSLQEHPRGPSTNSAARCASRYDRTAYLQRAGRGAVPDMRRALATESRRDKAGGGLGTPAMCASGLETAMPWERKQQNRAGTRTRLGI